MLSFLILRIGRAAKSEFYTTTSNNQLQWLDQEKAPKHSPKPNLYQIKVMVTVWWIHLLLYSFLNPGEIITSEQYTQQIDEMHRKLQLLQTSTGQQKWLSSSP